MSVLINNFSGGVAESKYQGVVGSYGRGIGIDPYSEPGILQCAQKLTKDSGTTVTDLILWAFQSTNGSTYFAGDSGKLYKRTSGGTWSNVRTESSRICGFIEYNGYFLWATSTKLYRMLIAGDWTDGACTVYKASTSTWSATLTDVTWAGTEANTSWHPMQVAPTGELTVGAGQYLTTVASSFTVNIQALDFPPDYYTKTLSYYRDDTVIGTYKASTNNNTANIYRWDNNASSFQVPTLLNEGGVNSIISQGNYGITQAGIDGALYIYDGAQSQLIRRIPGTYSPTKYSDTYPQAMAYRESLLHIGHSDITGSPSDHGVWTWGSLYKNIPPSLNLTYPISSGNLTAVTIGCILIVGLDMYVSWKDTTSGTVYGVDKLDFSNKYNGGIYETIVLGRGQPKKSYKRVSVTFEPLTSGCSLALAYRADGDTSYTTINLGDGSSSYTTANGTTITWDFNKNCHQVQFKLTLGSTSNSSPRVTALTIEDVPGIIV